MSIYMTPKLLIIQYTGKKLLQHYFKLFWEVKLNLMKIS